MDSGFLVQCHMIILTRFGILNITIQLLRIFKFQFLGPETNIFRCCHRNMVLVNFLIEGRSADEDSHKSVFCVPISLRAI